MLAMMRIERAIDHYRAGNANGRPGARASGTPPDLLTALDAKLRNSLRLEIDQLYAVSASRPSM